MHYSLKVQSFLFFSLTLFVHSIVETKGKSVFANTGNHITNKKHEEPNSCKTIRTDNLLVRNNAKVHGNLEVLGKIIACDCIGKQGKKGDRGKRGKNGKRGATGATGATGTASPGLNELFLNGLMIISSDDEGGPRPSVPLAPYGDPTGPNIITWELFPSPTFNVDPTYGANFTIPIDLDRTKPVTVVLHLLIPNNTIATGIFAKIQIDADYKNSYELLGIEPPATGFADTQVSPDFIITQPTPSAPDNSNLMHISTTVSLDPSKITGDWAFLKISRIPPIAAQYTGIIFLSTVSVQYTRI